VVQNPSKRFEEHGANGHHPERWNADGTDARSWAFDRLDTYWAMAPLPETDVAALLWGRTRRSSENIVTTSPYGFVCVVPGGAPQTATRWTSLWFTDGDRLMKEWKPVPLTDARVLLAAELAARAKAFPLSVEGRVFHQMIEQDPDHLAVVLVDPGWLDPADREVKITANHDTWRISDRLTGEALGDSRRPLTLRIPAGVFRLLDVRRE
jgi:hypothetical protein